MFEHTMKNGKKIPLWKMTDTHLHNTIKLLERTADKGFTVWESWGSDPSEFDYEEYYVCDEEALDILHYEEYKKEEQRRKNIRNEFMRG